MIRRLIQRLSTPIVASSLSLEQLCLSLVAIAQLEPFRLFPYTELHPLLPSGRDFDEAATVALVSHSMRLVPQCSFMELNMISSGAAALGWSSPSLIERFAKHVFEGHRGSHRSRGRLRLADFSRVVAAAIRAEQYFNITIYTLIRHCTKHFLRPRERVETLLHYAFLAHIYVGGHKEAMNVVLAELQTACLGENDRRNFLQKYEHFSHTVCRDWLARRQLLLSKFQSSYEHQLSQDHDQVAWDSVRVRVHMYLLLHKNVDPDSFSIMSGDISLKDVTECFELLSFSGVEDPVAELALERAVLCVMEKPDTISLEGLRRLNKVVYANTHRFPQLTEALNRKKDSNRSLAVLSKALEAYRQVVSGRRVSSITLHDLMQGLEDAQPDDMAYIAAVLSRQGGVPHLVTIRSSSLARCFSLSAIAALMRAVKWDRSRVLLTVAEVAVHSLDASALDSASLSVLLDLSGALALPLPRHINFPRSFQDAEATLKRNVLERMVSLCSSPSRSLEEIATAATQALAFDTHKALLHLTIDRAASIERLSTSEWRSVMRLLKLDNNVRSLKLMDKLSDRFKTLLGLCFQSHDHSNTDAFEALIEIAAFQSEYNAPELEGLGNELVYHVQIRMNACAPGCLVAAGLLAAQARGSLLVCKIRACLAPYVLQGTLHSSLATHLVGLIPPVVEPFDTSFTNALINYFSHIYCARASNVSGSGAFVDPSCIARLLVSYNEQYERLVLANDFAAFPEVLLEFIVDNLLALELEVYVGLCSSISGAPLSEAFTDEVVEVLPYQLDRLSSTQIAQCVWGLGQLRHAGKRLSHQVVMDQVSDYVVDNADLFWSGPDIAHLLDGFARLHCTKRSLYNVFAGKLDMRAVRATMSRETITLTLHAFGLAKYVHKPLFDRLTQVCMEHANDLSTSDIYISVLSHSRVMMLNSSFYAKMGQQIVSRSGEFSVTAKCELLKAYGHVGQEHVTLAQTLLQDIAHNIQELPNANEVVEILSALWRMKYNLKDDKNKETLALFLIDHAQQLTSESVTKLSSVLMAYGWRHANLLEAVGNQCVSLTNIQQLSATAGRTLLDAFAFLMIYHSEARRELAPLARSVSKEAVQLSEEEAEQLKLLLTE